MNPLKKIYVTLRGVAEHPLNRAAPFRAMASFCVAQVSVRLVPGDVCVPFPNRTKLLISPRMKGAAHFISPGLCEFEEMAFVMHFLRPDDLFVDVGANVGAYTLLAAGVAGAGGIAIEPSPGTFAYLRQNILLNELAARVTPIQAALGRAEGRTRLTDHLGTENFICPAGQDGGGIEVPVVPLDRLLSGRNPALIKVDVEGFETEVMAGARETLARPSLEAMIIERAGNAGRYGFDEAALHREIRARSFIPCAYSPAARKLNVLPENATGNLIYVKDVRRVEDRLAGGAAFEFAGHRI